MTLGQQQELFTENLAKLIQYAISEGYGCRLREVQRTPEQQAIYIKEGKSKTLNSRHIPSLAGDIYFTKDGKLVEGKTAEETKALLQPLGDYWESLNENNRWGGNYKTFIDCPHFEMV